MPKTNKPQNLEELIEERTKFLGLYYGEHNSWDNFNLILREEIQKVCDFAFVLGQMDAVKAQKDKERSWMGGKR